MISAIGILFLAITFIVLALIFILSQNYYDSQFQALRDMNVNFLPPQGIFRIVWFIFVITACIAYFLMSDLIGGLMRWLALLFLTFILALLLFNSSRFTYWSFALLILFAIMLLLGESIYHFGIVLEQKFVASLLGVYFLWSIYGLFLVSNVLYRISARENLIVSNQFY